MNIKKLIRYLPSFIKVNIYRLLGAHVGKNVKLGWGALLLANVIEIGDNVQIGSNCRVRCFELYVADNTIIGDSADIKVAGSLFIGKNSIFGSHLMVYCRMLSIGDFTYAGNDIELGYGSPTPESKIKIGHRCFIGSKTIINSEKTVEIGNDVGIGAETMIWTHGSWGPVLEGWPAKFAPVKIGNRAWIPARTIILPGIEIGEDTVISINSVVTRSLPPGALCAGNPARVIKERMFPKKGLSDEKKCSIVKEILKDYIAILIDKGVCLEQETNDQDNAALFKVKLKEYSIVFYDLVEENTVRMVKGERKRMLVLFMRSRMDISKVNDSNITFYDLSSLEIYGKMDEYAEDVRDYMRRKGIKIFTGNKFKSIQSMPFKRLGAMG